MGCFQSKPAAQVALAGAAPPPASGGHAGHPKQAAAAPVQQQPAAGTIVADGKPAVKNGQQPQPQRGDVCATAQAADPKYNPAEGEGQPSCPLMVLYKDVGGDASLDVPMPADEQDRFDQLCSYNILDTEPEEAYDRITALCKTLFNVPIAMVTFVDRDRVWLKSVQGLAGLKQVERRKSICAWTLLSRYPEALVVPNLTQDARFSTFPVVVGWPHVRFYAACPLVNHNGMRLGTLCILDTSPREFSADSTMLLTQLANMVMREVERKRAVNDALCSAALRHHSGDSITNDSQGIMLTDMSAPKWTIHLVNDAWQRVTGISQEMAVGSHFWDLFEPPPTTQVQAYRLAIEQCRNFELRVPINAGSHSGFYTPLDAGSLVSSTCGSSAGVRGGSQDSLGGGSIGAPGSAHTSASNPAPWQQGAMHGVHDWGDGSGNRLLVVPGGGSGGRPPVCAAAAADRALAPPGGIDPARRRSLGGNVRFIRFQFRSVASVAAHMAPAVSVPPVLMVNADTRAACYYWATVDMPSAGSMHRGEDASDAAYFGGFAFDGPRGIDAGAGGGSSGGAAAAHASGQQQHGSMSSSHCPSSGHYTVPSSDSSASATGHKRTTFSLLPEDNPFQEITLGSLLGWGSYGRVHRGCWNGSLVAVKVLEQVAGDFNPRTSLEPLLHHRLSHPNVVAMFDVCTQELDVCEDGRALQEVWMVLEFCNRGTLSDAIQRGWMLNVCDGVLQAGQVNMAKALVTAREVAGAMEYLHSQNVLHGDLNGNNILLAGSQVVPGAGDQRGFTAKVADFGLSRLLSPENEKIITRTHGTITHMAPEVITEATHSKAADVYSFGVVLFELLSGSRPYTGMHYAQIVASITSGRLLQLLPESTSHLPTAVVQLAAQCLASNPAERPTFADVHARLQDIEQRVLAAQADEAGAAPPQQQVALQQALPRKRQQPPPQPASTADAAAVAAAAAAAAAAADASGVSDGTSRDGTQTLADILAAAQQQQPPPLQQSGRV